MKTFVTLIVILGLAAGGYYLYRAKHLHSSNELRLRTGKVERGQVVEGVAASGAVQPFLLVQVGTNVSGTVDKLFKDWNDRVKAGECVALIDSRRYLAQVAQDHASIGQAKANYEQTKAKLVQAERDLVRNRVLAEKRLVADSDLDAAIANAESLRAQLDLTAAVVSQNIAQLQGDQLNVEYSRILSPVDGVIVSRNVDVGQTVAASFNTPTLFQIANDLTKIQVQAQVPEAEVGRIKVGQHVPFRVDAYPDLTFEGIVSQIRLASANVQNVVTYTVMVDAANPKELLLPGMTANATFEVAKSEKEALTVPVAALRFKPADEMVDPASLEKDKADKAEKAEAAKQPEKGLGERVDGEKPAAKPGDKGDKPDRKPGDKPDKPAGEQKHKSGQRGRVFVRSDAQHVRPIKVRVLVSDGVRTAVEPLKGETLEEGAEVVLSLAPEEEEAATNPFQPNFGRPSGRK